jgi:hypothetical protein
MLYRYNGPNDDFTASGNTSYYESAATNVDKYYGWRCQDCTTATKGTCKFPASIFPCNPPPLPPPPPPRPPSPPAPPAPPNCVPSQSSTFFCDFTENTCYKLTPSNLNFTQSAVGLSNLHARCSRNMHATACPLDAAILP